MGLGKTLLKKGIEHAAYRKCLEQLNTMTEAQITVEYVMAGFQNDLTDDDRGQLEMVGLTQDDILDIVKSIVPKLQKEKRKRQ